MDHVITDYVAGAIAGTAGLIVGHPLDTTKVHLQIQTRRKVNNGTLATAANINRHGIIKGFFRGMSLPMLCYGLTNSVFFGVYGNLLKQMHIDRHNCNQQRLQIFLAGSVGGTVQLIPAIPIDYVKVVLQSQIQDGSAVRFKGPFQCATYVIKNNGLQGIYKGGVPMFCRDCLAFGLYGLTYETLSSALKTRSLTDSYGLLADFVGGGVAGCVSWITTMPMDVIKSRYQADMKNMYKSPLDCVLQSYKQEGLTVFFRGAILSCFRAFPVNGVMFLVYAQIIEYLNH